MTPARKAELVLKVEAAMTDIAPMLRDGVGPETQVYQWAYDIILDALQHVEREVWAGLKVTNEQLQWALKEVGPSGTRAEAYVLAVVEYVIAKRTQAKETT